MFTSLDEDAACVSARIAIGRRFGVASPYRTDIAAIDHGGFLSFCDAAARRPPPFYSATVARICIRPLDHAPLVDHRMRGTRGRCGWSMRSLSWGNVNQNRSSLLIFFLDDRILSIYFSMMHLLSDSFWRLIFLMIGLYDLLLIPTLVVL